MSLYKNASPEYILLGADDKGSRPLPTERNAVPQHVPMIYMFARKGTTKKILGTGGLATAVYGGETFNTDAPYFTHTNRLAVGMYGAANTCMHKRLIPTDAGAKANVVVYIDVLKTNVANYVRDANGNKAIDPVTNQFQIGTPTTIPGTEVKFISEVSADLNVGMAVPKPGTMTDGVNSSTMYPLFEHRAAEYGDYYNNIGYAIEAALGAGADTDVMSAAKALVYKLSLVTRTDAAAPTTTLRSLYGEPAVNCTLKAGVKHPITGLKIDASNVFNDNWFNEKDPLKTIRYNDYQGMYVYTTDLETVLASIMADEKSHVDINTIGWFDYTTFDQVGLDAETHLLNIFSGKSTKGISYMTLVVNGPTASTLAAGQKEVQMSKDTPVYLAGGSDGTMDNAMFESLVKVELAKYLDPDSEVIDNAVNLETHMYDSGFTVDTKQQLFNVMAVRKDMIAVVGTHDAQDKLVTKSVADTRAIAVLLKTKAKLFPESDYFGTPTARAVIVSGAFKMFDDVEGNYLPFTFEVALKSARMMSGGNYKWKSTYSFDHGTAAELKYGYDYQPEFIPAGVKPQLWNAGMVWAQPKNRDTYFIPAIQTVYDDDTSPLNNWLTVCGLVTLNRVASDGWREFTGTSTMDDNQFKEAVLDYINGRVQGIFDGLLTVIPEVIITENDAQRGYSWQIMFKLYAGNMKTKMVSYTEVYRLSDLTVQ